MKKTILKMEITDWLRYEYGLDDDDCSSAGQVAECVEEAVYKFNLKAKKEALVGAMVDIVQVRNLHSNPDIAEGLELAIDIIESLIKG